MLDLPLKRIAGISREFVAFHQVTTAGRPGVKSDVKQDFRENRGMRVRNPGQKRVSVEAQTMLDFWTPKDND